MRYITWRNERIAFDGLCELAHEHAYGRAWYDASGQSVAEYAASIGQPSRYVCDVVAILSPRVSRRRYGAALAPCVATRIATHP